MPTTLRCRQQRATSLINLRDSNVEMLHNRINLFCAVTSLFSVCHAFAPSSVIRGKLILNMQSEHNEKNVPSFTDLEEIRSIAMIAAKRAGEIILSNSSGMDVSKTKANARDLLVRCFLLSNVRA